MEHKQQEKIGQHLNVSIHREGGSSPLGQNTNLTLFWRLSVFIIDILPSFSHQHQKGNLIFIEWQSLWNWHFELCAPSQQLDIGINILISQISASSNSLLQFLSPRWFKILRACQPNSNPVSGKLCSMKSLFWRSWVVYSARYLTPHDSKGAGQARLVPTTQSPG